MRNKTLYLGKSIKTFNDIRSILEENDIDYRCKISNRNESFISPGIGVSRSFGGNIGKDSDDVYEILVSKGDTEKAKMLLCLYEENK